MAGQTEDWEVRWELLLADAWADADLQQDFVGFDPIDLSGFSTTVGIVLVF